MSAIRKVILYCLYIVAVGVLAGVIVKSFYPSNSKTDSTSKTTTQSKNRSVVTKQSKTKSTTASKPVTPKKSDIASKSKPKTVNNPTQPAPTTLENTGPGNVIGLFAVTFTVGTIGYHTYQRRRHADIVS